jgi:hypothetical protein
MPRCIVNTKERIIEKVSKHGSVEFSIGSDAYNLALELVSIGVLEFDNKRHYNKLYKKFVKGVNFPDE